MKLGLLFGAAALSFLVAAPAQATAFVSPTSVTFDNTDLANFAANTAVFNFNGMNNNGNPNSGLAAQLTLRLDSINGATNSYNFAYSLTNFSSLARVSGFGFDVNPDVTSASSAGVYDFADLVEGDFPNGNSVEVCFHGSNTQAQLCPQSNNQAGNFVAAGDTGTGTLTLTFASAPTSITLNNFLNRYQGPAGYGVGSAVPEPGTWAMMLLGFGAIGWSVRRRRAPMVKFLPA